MGEGLRVHRTEKVPLTGDPAEPKHSWATEIPSLLHHCRQHVLTLLKVWLSSCSYPAWRLLQVLSVRTQEMVQWLQEPALKPEAMISGPCADRLSICAIQIPWCCNGLISRAQMCVVLKRECMTPLHLYIHPFISSFIHLSFVYSYIHPFIIHSFIHWFIPAAINSFIYPFLNLVIHLHSVTHSIIHPFFPPLMLSLNYSPHSSIHSLLRAVLCPARHSYLLPFPSCAFLGPSGSPLTINPTQSSSPETITSWSIEESPWTWGLY